MDSLYLSKMAVTKTITYWLVLTLVIFPIDFVIGAIETRLWQGFELQTFGHTLSSKSPENVPL